MLSEYTVTLRGHKRRTEKRLQERERDERLHERQGYKRRRGYKRAAVIRAKQCEIAVDVDSVSCVDEVALCSKMK